MRIGSPKSSPKSNAAKGMTKEIKKIMKENPSVSANEIAEILNTTAETVRYRIKVLE